MSHRIQILCAWAGPAMVGVTLFGWLVAGILPIPLGSSSTAAEVLGLYGHDTRVLIGS